MDPKKIFIIGHSMGAMLAPRIDEEGGDFAGLILMAGTPRKLEEVLIEQTEEVLSSLTGFARKLGEKQAQQLRRTFDGLYEMTDEQAVKKKVGGGTTLYYFKEMGQRPVSGYLTQLQKPILILQGDKDFQVKADRDFEAYREILKEHPNAVFRLYKDLNHCFVPSVYGSISKAKQEYNIEQHISPQVIADIADWIVNGSNV